MKRELSIVFKLKMFYALFALTGISIVLISYIYAKNVLDDYISEIYMYYKRCFNMCMLSTGLFTGLAVGCEYEEKTIEHRIIQTGRKRFWANKLYICVTYEVAMVVMLSAIKTLMDGRPDGKLFVTFGLLAGFMLAYAIIVCIIVALCKGYTAGIIVTICVLLLGISKFQSLSPTGIYMKMIINIIK